MYACLSVCLCLGARCSFVVERPLVVRWVVESILYGGPIELFLVQTGAPQQVYITHCPRQTAQAAEVCDRTACLNRTWIHARK